MTAVPRRRHAASQYDGYTWVRDGSFSIYALLGLGYVDEARAFAAWLRDRGAEYTGAGDHPLTIMYRVDGSPDLAGETLDHFEGWRGSQPVRIGNGAAETRGRRKDFTYGRFQSWVALDRAIRMAQHRGRPANLTRWSDQRDAIYQQIMERGWNSKVGAFTRHYGTDVLDSALLKMPLEGFIAPDDPMWLSPLHLVHVLVRRCPRPGRTAR